MSDIAVRVENLGKSYRIVSSTGGKRYKTLQEDMIGFLKNPLRRGDKSETFWALKDVSFEVKHGEVLGIIGRNGAGKSTLLKILSRITRPTTGYADVYGRVGSLLEVGTGFHPELTGRENIYLNGAILGMSRAEISRRFDEIVAFAEVEQFLDTPAKRYSSGMYMRLAFAVAAHLDPEVLIVDEVLAVGDAEFQKKCLGKMSEVASSGRTVLFVSHNMAAVEALCSQGIVLDRGEIKFLGNSSTAVQTYLESYEDNLISLVDRRDRIGTGEIQVTGIQIKDPQGNMLDTVKSGQDIDIFFYYEAAKNYFSPRLRFSLLLKTQSDMPLFLHHNRLIRHEFSELQSEGAFICRIKNLPLTANKYRITYSVMLGEETFLDYIDHAAEITVVDGDFYGFGEIPKSGFGPMLIEADWFLAEEVLVPQKS